jgi:hypothetical protein
MSYVSARNEIRDVLAAVSGVDKAIVGYPTSVQVKTLIYVEYTDGERVPNPPSGQVIKNHVRVTATLCVQMQDNVIAEDRIAPFIDSIPLAILAYSQATRQIAYVVSHRGDVRPIGVVQGESAGTYRVVDFIIQIVYKDP